MTPSFVEFFALFRGYGLAFAFLLMAVYHTLRSLTERDIKHMVFGLFAWSLAGWSMLSLSLVWCVGVVLLMVAILVVQRQRRDRIVAVSCWIILGVTPLALGILFGSELRERGSLYDGTEEGLVNGTYRLLLTTLFAWGEGPTFLWTSLLIMFATAVAMVHLAHAPRDRWRHPLTIILVLVLAEALGRMMLWKISGVRFPMGRTALHWVPLLVIWIALAADVLAVHRKIFAVLALPLLALPWHAWRGRNVRYVAVWPEETLAPELLRTMEALQRNAGRPLLIDAYDQMDAQWDYARLWKHYDLPPVSQLGFPQPLCDLVLVDTVSYRPPAGFRQVRVEVPGRQTLYARQHPLGLTVLGDTSMVLQSSTDEFVGLAWPQADMALRDNSALEFVLVVRSQQACLNARLAIEVSDSSGGHRHYESIEMRQQQRVWQGDTLHFIRRVPPLSTTYEKALVYLWNPDRQEMEVPFCRVRSLRIDGDADLRNTNSTPWH